MKSKRQIYFLAALLLLLAWVVIANWEDTAPIVAVFTPDKYQPLQVENPELRLDLLEKIRKQEYAGAYLNIFTGRPIPPPVQPAKVVEPPKSDVPPPPPPLQLPVKFFGFAADPQSGKKRAFFTNGDDVFILTEGEVLLTKFRLLRIGNTAADFEEVSSGRRATLPLELPPEGSGL
jgi:hypothetical protein